MPNVRFNESYTLKDPPKNARPRQSKHLEQLHAQVPIDSTRTTTPPISITYMNLQPKPPPDTQPLNDPRHPATYSGGTELSSAHCAKCNHPFGALPNRFEKVTGSYFLHLDQTASSRLELKAEGKAKELGPKHYALEGCTVQALACTSCADRFAFRCVVTPPEKIFFNHRIFFKLERVSLLNQKTGVNEPPLVISTNTNSGQVTGPTPLPKGEDPLDSPLARPTMPSIEHPDYEAARGILMKQSWSAVHAHWEHRTGEGLSPKSFGDRISPYVKELEQRQPAVHGNLAPVHSREPSEVRPIANGRTIPQANGSGQVDNVKPRILDSLEAQRADINRLDAGLSRVRADFGELRGLINDLRYELQSAHSHRGSGGTEDSSTLDSLTETVGRMASRTGEIDGLRFEMTALKSKVKRMEEAQGIPTTPSQPSQSFTRSEPSLQPAPPPHPEIAARGWNAVNTSKRKSLDENTSFEPSKRPRADHRTPSGEVTVAYAPHAVPAPAPAPAPSPPTLAPIRSNSQESWHPDSQRLPPLRGMHQGGRGGTRPPRLHPPQELATPDWERASWDESRVDRDGYYRPLNHPVGGPPSPGAAKRGNIVRRGTAGGGAPLQYIDPAPAKRTRQRPIRNDQGILIRKDGKPDQRSISSPQNLRKVHERRIAEQERGSQDSPNSPSSPAETEAPRSAGEFASAVGSSGSGSPALEQQEHMYQSDSRQSSRPASKHDRVMSKMFPRGLGEDAHRMNHAARIFEPDSQKHHAAQLRTAMEKDEARDDRYEEHDERSPRAEIQGTSVEASGSVYVPSQGQMDSSKSTHDETVIPATATATANTGVSTDSAPQDSDNRPLRVRQVAKEVEPAASGSVYQPSPTEAGNV